MLESGVLYLIALYQKYISPRKGFHCSYRIATGGLGCSGFGKRVFEKHGLILGVIFLRRRFAKCAWYAQRLRKTTAIPISKNLFLRGQGGFSDCAGDLLQACDCGAGNGFSLLSELLSPGAVSGCDCTQPSCCASGGADREESRMKAAQERIRTNLNSRNAPEHDSEDRRFNVRSKPF